MDTLGNAGIQNYTHKYAEIAYSFKEGGKFSIYSLLQSLQRTTLQQSSGISVTERD